MTLVPNFEDEEEKISFISDRFKEIMLALGLNLEDPSLAQTPHRVAKMYVKEFFWGLSEKNMPALTSFENSDRETYILIRDIPIASTCEHHFVPIIGHANVAYLAKDKLLGLSKVNRLVHYFAKRPQLQERLTLQIAQALAKAVETDDVAVTITAKHFCVVARGVEDESSTTTTTHLLGKFHDDIALRTQFLIDTQSRSTSSHSKPFAGEEPALEDLTPRNPRLD